MEQPEDSPRDLAALVVSRVGRLDGSGAGCDPYRLVDGDGAVIEAVAEYFRDLQAAGRSASTLRSYGLDLLRWFRFLWAIGVPWSRASRIEARDFCRWMLIAGKPSRPHWRRRGELVEQPSAVKVSRRRCGRIARRCCAASTSSTWVSSAARSWSTLPVEQVAARRPGERAPQSDGAVHERAERALPSANPGADPALDTGRGVQRDLRPAAVASGPGAGGVLRVHRGQGLGVAVGDAGRDRSGAAAGVGGPQGNRRGPGAPGLLGRVRVVAALPGPDGRSDSQGPSGCRCGGRCAGRSGR